MNKRIFELTGFFGWWGMKQTIEVKAQTYKEATTNLKPRVMKMFKGRGKGRNQTKFYCKVTGYRVVEEVKPYKEFK